MSNKITSSSSAPLSQYKKPAPKGTSPAADNGKTSW